MRSSNTHKTQQTAGKGSFKRQRGIESMNFNNSQESTLLARNSNEEKTIQLQPSSIKLKHFDFKERIKPKLMQSQEQFQSSFGNTSQAISTLSRKASRRLMFSQGKQEVSVSQKNKLLIQNFLQKLKRVEDYAASNQQASQDYLSLIREFNRKQNQYSSMIRSYRIITTAKEEEILHNSPSNIKIRRELLDDVKKMRQFASRHNCLLYKKQIASFSVQINREEPKQSKLKTSKSLTKTISPPAITRQIKQQANQASSQQYPQGDKQEAQSLFPYLKLKKRQPLNRKDHLNQGLNFLAKWGRMKQKSQESQAQPRGKIRLIKEIVHHWKVDNRFLRVSTEFQQFQGEAEGQRKIKQQNNGSKQITVRSNKGIQTVP